MIKYKIERIAHLSFRSYKSARKRVLNLAPVMKGRTRIEKIENACDMILVRLKNQQIVFRNVNFYSFYRGII